MPQQQEQKRRVAVISGYFSPVHAGHVEYARLAKEFVGPDGFLYCIVNNDAQSILKKGFSFIPETDRLAVMGALKYVDRAVLSIDTDRTVCETLKALCDGRLAPLSPAPTHFLNGGDVTALTTCPEEPVCRANNIELVYGFGDKIQSSSWILAGAGVHARTNQ